MIKIRKNLICGFFDMVYENWKGRTDMIYTDLTKKALRISFAAHKDQFDKSGIPYVYHPYEVASGFDTEDEVCVALLHDVVEDTDMTFDDLAREGFGENVIGALKLLTHSDDTPYFEYVKAVKQNPLAKAVKLADLRHNSTRSRMNVITDWDEKRYAKYATAIKMLTED